MACDGIEAWVDEPAGRGVPLARRCRDRAGRPDPGAIYTVGLNYRAPGEPMPAARPARSIYGKASSSVAGHGAVLSWDRALTANVDPSASSGS